MCEMSDLVIIEHLKWRSCLPRMYVHSNCNTCNSSFMNSGWNTRNTVHTFREHYWESRFNHVRLSGLGLPCSRKLEYLQSLRHKLDSNRTSAFHMKLIYAATLWFILSKLNAFSKTMTKGLVNVRLTLSQFRWNGRGNPVKKTLIEWVTQFDGAELAQNI